MLKYTGFKTPKELFEETTNTERVFLGRSIFEYEKQKAKMMGF